MVTHKNLPIKNGLKKIDHSNLKNKTNSAILDRKFQIVRGISVNYILKTRDNILR